MKSWQRNALAMLIVGCAAIMAAQEAPPKPKISNAKVQQLSASAGLKATVDGLVQKQTTPLWIGYRIPTAAKERTMCCFDSVDQFQNSAGCCLGCRMESEKGGSINGTVSNCSQPEPLPYAFIFMRAADGQIGKVRVYSADCALDFANLPVYWVVNVVDRVIEVYTQPAGEAEAAAYTKRDDFAVGSSVPVVLDGATVGAIAVADVMG